MNLTGQNIRYINTITHDGKVLVFGTADGGAIYYSIKRSGFEDTAVKEGADPFGFESWKKLRLGESTADASVTTREKATVADTSGNLLIRSVYGNNAEVTNSANASVQLVSALNHLYVFRQSPSGKLLVNRFVLDGMTNTLMPKLEVRFRRSKQRFEAQNNKTTTGVAFDNLDYRDIDGASFIEPALELSFVGTVGNGWFAPLFVPTAESDRNRWHLFAYDPTINKLVLYTVGADANGSFDIKDYLYAQKDPKDPKKITYRSTAGIIRRTIDLQGMTIAGGLSATTYDIQREQITDAGPQLIRDVMRVMLAMPVKVGPNDPMKTAVLDFALAADGTLSRIDLTADTSVILRSSSREVITPLILLDDIKEIATLLPPPAGTIVATERGAGDQLQVRSRDTLPSTFKAGSKVKIRGTKSYDGHYKVLSVDGSKFNVEAVFQNNEAGFWEVTPDQQTGLVFDNMIVGSEKSADGKLTILCAAHDLKVNDEVQISGARECNGTFPVKTIDPNTKAFVLDAPYFTGQAANLTKVARRGLRMNGNDRVETPDLELLPPNLGRNLGRTLSAWVRVDAAGNAEQSLIKDSGGMMNLAVGIDNRVKLAVRMSDGSTQTVTDPNPIPVNTWTHYAGSVEHFIDNQADTRIRLCRNGSEVATRTFTQIAPVISPPAAAGAKLSRVMQFDGIDDDITIPNSPNLANKSLTVEVWAKRARAGVNDFIFTQGGGGDNLTLHLGFRDSNIFFLGFGNNDCETSTGYTDTDWHHWAGTYDASTKTQRVYRDGTLVAERVASAHYQGNGVIIIGRFFENAFRFQGGLADMRIWDRARSQAEIAQDMGKRLTGKETGLLAYWPLDAAANDLSIYLRNGVLNGNPALINTGSAFIVGKSFDGEISEAQIWDIARSAADIKATMHLQLTGKEQGLVANYRLGAIVYGDERPSVPDFTVNGRNGLVFGDPYAGARRLNRATGSGMKVVKYGSEELVAVSQRGVYEETFEFRVTSPDSTFTPTNADGTGQKLFAFAYWGKSSRGSKEIVPFPASSVQPSDFVSLGGGWYKTSCRVVIPDGIGLMRAFEIADVRGKWGSEATAPAGEWTAIDIRKHRIRLVSDAITRESFTDALVLSSLPAQSQTVIDNLTQVRRAEETTARLELQVADILARLDVVKNNQRYVNEKNTLVTNLQALQSQKSTLQSERSDIVNNVNNYWMCLRAKHSGKVADALIGESDWRVQQYTKVDNNNQQLFRLQDVGGGWFKIHGKCRDGYPLTPRSDTYVELSADRSDNSQKFRLIDCGAGNYFIENSDGRLLDVSGVSTGEGAFLWLWSKTGGDNQRWARDQSTELTSQAQELLKTKDSQISAVDAQIAPTQQRINWLTNVLAASDTQTSLESQLATVRSNLNTARTELATKNTAVLSALSTAAPATMPVVATDSRELTTNAAVLDFAQPTGSVRLMESCEGNVLLTYFDNQGRMRTTIYDATADSRNAAFEQWVPDGIRACADIRDNNDKITLAKAVTLPANGWTCQAWVQYPLATKSDGTAYNQNVIVAAENNTDAALVVRKGKRLGMLVDGWFFDSGVDLERKLAVGWHEFAVSNSRNKATFYANGVEVGSRKTMQPVLRCNGSSDYIEVPAYTHPPTAITVSVWARSAGSTWNNNACLVTKRNGFIMHPLANTLTMAFGIFVGGVEWRCAQYTPTDVQGWHLYTGTFDGAVIRLYIDGDLVSEVAVAGTLGAESGVMQIGHDVRAAAQENIFRGDVADVAIWNTARSPSDVRDDMYRTFKGDESGLVGYWRMEKVDEGGTIKVKDLTSNARHGLVKGAPQDATITTTRSIDIKVLGNTSGGGSPIGRLAEVRLWKLGLSDAEILNAARTVASGNEPGLVGYWPLNEATGSTASDRSAGGEAHGTLVAVDWAGCTANVGNLGSKVLNLPDQGKSYVACSGIELANKSFSIECWARQSGANINSLQIIATMGTQATNAGLHFGFREGGYFTLDFYSNGMNAGGVYTDTDWHHWCGTYDVATKTMRIHCDGVMVGERTGAPAFTGIGALTFGKYFDDRYFQGDIAEVRVWDKARSTDEIRSTMRRRLTGTEPNLVAYYPMDEVNEYNKIKDKKSGTFSGELKGIPKVVSSTSLPMAGADNVVTAEYSTIELGGDSQQQALMRRFYAYAPGGVVELVPEQRVEELTLQWVGNTQINPTLLGYIEGAPPVPAENLTEKLSAGYNKATGVTLTQSNDTSYRWQRSETSTTSFNLDGFVGAAWDVGSGAFLVIKTAKGEAGALLKYALAKTDAKDSAVSASSSLATTDSLKLTGAFEDKPMSPILGKRWVPKNVGYALVVSGTADVFVTKLKRSGRMVSYDIRPVDGIPLDVNTITFMINPAYTLNGSLDGLTGSMPADPKFYAHVPQMRAQYGSLYPASYYRLQEAYDLKKEIQRQDKERESFFYNFNADQLDQIDSFKSSTNGPSLSPGSTPTAASDPNAMAQQNEQQKKETQNEAEKRQAEIAARNSSLEGRVRAGAAFSDWQLRMEKVQTRAAKRNIVNTYVWDGDGGLRAEEESFAGTIEHSLSSQTSNSGGGGAKAESAIVGFKFSLSAVATYGRTDATSKKLTMSQSLKLNVDLSGVENAGITDLQDYPLKPGEKVDRYRFMTFYLEGSTDHFHDFFSYVVDPEWLMSNDEEARALRMARSTTPNKCWRVLHRVTYVERPALMIKG